VLGGGLDARSSEEIIMAKKKTARVSKVAPEWEQAAQGDLLVIRITDRKSGIPATARPVEPTCGRHIVAHSETGHHHYLAAVGTRHFESESPLIGFLSVQEPTQLLHDRAFDTHAPISLSPGKYEFRRAREWTGAMARRVED
jgi:hypothetical protein